MDWTKILITLVFQVVKNVSPEIKNEIQRHVTELKRRAKETVNPWDDILVTLLEGLIGFKP